MPTCPDCAEEIEAEATKCRACGKPLVEAPQPAPAPSEPPEGPALPGEVPGPLGVLVVIGLVAGFAAGSPLEGWAQSAFTLGGALAGAGLWWLLDGPLARLRGAKPPPSPPTPSAEPPAPE